VTGIEKYLGSGLIKGIGPGMAKRITARFGAETLTVIEETPERMGEVPGVGPKRAELIKAAWAEQRAVKEVMIFLQSNGVSTSLAAKIYRHYGDDSIMLVRSDPYRLARDIYGIGFLTADKIAQALGLPPDAPERVAAGVTYALTEAADEGHVYVPTGELIRRTAELVKVAPQSVGLGLAQLATRQEIIVAQGPGGDDQLPALAAGRPAGAGATPQLVFEAGGLYAAATLDLGDTLAQHEHAIYLSSLFYSEVGVANRLHRLAWHGASRLAAFAHVAGAAWADLLHQASFRTEVALAPQQAAAVQAALTHRVTVLTGGPGTGKTTTMRAVLDLAQRAQRRVLLAAPTGRAAKRLAETTGAEAKTIHRLLEYQPGEGLTFGRNEDNPLECDLLIVDEASMLDLPLTHHLLKALAPGTHLLLVGDIDQLPSVGAGNVLRDVIGAIESDSPRVGEPAAAVAPRPATERMKVVRLETIFRQAAGSYIITNAHRINRGEMPLIDNDGASDFFFFKTEEPERTAQLCAELLAERIPRRFGIPAEEIQLLSPMHRGVGGVAALNERLQQTLNPPATGKAQRAFGQRLLRTGDRVMQIRNNYDKDVYNGDMGQIVAIDLVMHTVTVLFDGRPVSYDFLETDELSHAFAVSVHKSQGSEFPAVVIPLLTGHFMMLQRNLLYTAVTRAKRLVVLVGAPKALAMAVRNNDVTRRFSGLRERMAGPGPFATPPP
jgi:exodeoxyribonuclease V alpha subunit